MPGVIAVLTGSDAERDGLQPIPHSPVPANPHEVPLKSGDGSPFFLAPHPVLSVGKVRHVGEAVAVVVAKTMSQATDAAERVEVRYEPLPAVTRSADAMAPEAPLVWEEHGANLCVDSEAGDQGALPCPNGTRLRTKPRGLKPTGVFTHAPERKKHWVLRSASSAAATLSRKLVSTATANY
jgi:CO/xanthine dehydrogenase Mo-binding subunit